MTTISTRNPLANRLTQTRSRANPASSRQETAFWNDAGALIHTYCCARLDLVGMWRDSEASILPNGSLFREPMRRAYTQLQTDLPYPMLIDHREHAGLRDTALHFILNGPASEASNSASTIRSRISANQLVIARPGQLLEPSSELEVAPHPVVQEFADGIDGVHPSPDVVDMAVRIVQAAVERTADAEFSVDVDGALSFVLRLTDDRLILAELDPDGSLDASRYDDDYGKNVKRLRQATAEDLIRLF